jgi:uncharacterized protein YhhL (DUF1145 family)
MLQAMIYVGKGFTAVVWLLGIWAWSSFTGIGNDPSFFTQLMRMVSVVTLGGHLLLAFSFFFWARTLGLATASNMAQVFIFGMFHVADVWLKRAESKEQKPNQAN